MTTPSAPNPLPNELIFALQQSYGQLAAAGFRKRGKERSLTHVCRTLSVSIGGYRLRSASEYNTKCVNAVWTYYHWYIGNADTFHVLHRQVRIYNTIDSAFGARGSCASSMENGGSVCSNVFDYLIVCLSAPCFVVRTDDNVLPCGSADELLDSFHRVH